jgi:hypothetical protein
MDLTINHLKWTKKVGIFYDFLGLFPAMGICKNQKNRAMMCHGQVGWNDHRICFVVNVRF